MAEEEIAVAHPYKSLPDRAFWRRSVAGLPAGAVDPVGDFALRITSQTRVATAGSCFAQHISRALRMAGLAWLNAEPGHPVIPGGLRAQHGYGTFSARFGNIYTARQLVQLFDRAHGNFTPAEPPWIDPDGTVRDPFRPAIQPGNFVSVTEMEADRAGHLAAVRQMFATLDVLVFTLGLTEAWESAVDGAVFPLCPGVEGGQFDPARHVFRSHEVEDVVADMEAFLARLAGVNPGAQVVLTVSPVPLMATAEPGAHVLAATTWSKAVLRVAAGRLARRHAYVHYFPAYEIVTGAHARGAYFAADLRSVTKTGVAHVMRLFLQHAAGITADAAPPGPRTAEAPPDPTQEAARQFVALECEEATLDRPEGSPPKTGQSGGSGAG
jgi:hypothetical protein